MIAIVAGAVVARFSGGLARWPMATLLVLWPSFSFIGWRLWFLNWLRPLHLQGARGSAKRLRLALVVWFVGGTGPCYLHGFDRERR